MTIEIDRVRNIDVQEFHENYSRRGKPVILQGGIEHWPARKKWSLDYFSSEFPEKNLQFGGQQWVLGEFIGRLRHGEVPAPYLKEVKIDEQFPELKGDIGSLEYTRNNLLNSSLLPRSMRIHKGIKALFIGAAGSGFGKLHWDYSCLHAFISQILGQKHFVLFDPADTPHLYADPHHPNKSLIENFNSFELGKYPNVSRATPIQLTTGPGDTLFIPAGWWHATSMRDISISVAESSLDASNWRQRSDWYLGMYRRGNVSSVKVAMLNAYMRGVEKLAL